MLEIAKYARNPFVVDAVQVTEDNMAEVAKWCGGDIRTTAKANHEPGGTKYIKVRVNRPLNERQSKAYVGDWVLYAGTGYKVYTPKAFGDGFTKVGTGAEEQLIRNIFSNAHEEIDDTGSISETPCD